MNNFFNICICFFFVCSLYVPPASGKKKEAIRPNIVIIFADDLGYGDLSSYGGEGIQTPNIDRIGTEGIRFTDFFVPANVCSPSRASILTGRYPMRNGFPIPRNYEWKKQDEYGLHTDELTIPMFIKQVGYKSMCIGKWHLGFLTEGSHPIDKGFDNYFGIMSNYKEAGNKILYQDKDTLKENVVFEELTGLYTDKAIDFIHKNKENPFFLYFSHHAIHTPIKPSDKFKGTSERGAYGDYIHELDHSTGRVIDAIKEAGIEKNTLVIFTSDNGPARAHVKGASSGGLAGGKYGTMEGGHRVPGMISWKGQIKGNQVSDVTVTSMDILPTIASILGEQLPDDRYYDGKNILPVLRGESSVSPHEYLYYYNGINLQAIRKGNWKLHLPRCIDDQPFWSKKGNNKGFLELYEHKLYNLNTDIGEKIDLSDKYPKIVGELINKVDKIRKELGDINIIGYDQRVVPYDCPQER